MNTPRHRFTVTPFLTAFFAALAFMPGLNVVNVHADGMGIEHEQPWVRPSSPIASTITAARALVARLSESLTALQRHALFKPVAVGSAALAMAYLHPDSPALMALPFAFGVITEGQHAGEFLLGERPDGGARENITVLSGQNLEAGDVVGRVSLGIGRVSIPTVVGTGTGTVSAVFAGPEVEVGNYVMTCTAAVAHGGVFSLTTPGGKALPTVTMTPGSGGSTVYTSRHINFTITDSGDFIVGDAFTFVVSTTVPTVIGGTGTGVLSALSLGPDAKPGRYQIVNNVVVSGGGDMSVIGPDGNNVGGRFIWAASGSTASFTSRQINFTISDATDYIAANYFDVCVFNQLNGGKVVEWDPTTFDGRHKAVGVLYDNVDASSSDLAGVIVTRDAVVMKDSLIWAAAITAAQKESAYLDLALRGVIAR